MIDYEFGCTLSTIGTDDLPIMRKWRNDERIWKWCRQNDLIPDYAHLSWFEKIGRDSSIKMYAIKDADLKTVGICGLTSIDMMNRNAEFSMYVGPEYWRKGYGEAALKTLLSHGYQNLGLNLIWGETFNGNPALNLFDKVGFRREGMRRQCYFKGGKFIDAHRISLTASEYLK